MFTGLIEEIGVVRSCKRDELVVACDKVLEDAKVGDSIAVNGVCLTLTNMTKSPGAMSLAHFHVSPTTVEATRFSPSGISAGEEVNLERALTLSARLGGHLVSGHVDGTARVVDVSHKGGDRLIEVIYPKQIKPFIARKGSVTIDGVSLTVAEVLSTSFTVMLIPETLAKTNLKNRRAGDHVHIEADMFARYVYNIMRIEGMCSGRNSFYSSDFLGIKTH